MIICEIGINHLGSEIRAKRMVNQLLKKKIDAITFQIPSKDFINNFKIKTKELRIEFYQRIIKIIHKKKKKVGFAISDKKLVKKLDKFGCDFWKILSRDFYNDNLLSSIKKTKKKTFISTGFSNLREIKNLQNKFGRNSFFIHTALSHRYEDVNLEAIKLMKKRINKKKIAFGLHSPDIKILYYAQIYNPISIFFYVKTSENIEFPDNKHAIEISNINSVVENLNSLKLSLGDGTKRKINIKNKFDTGKIK